MKLVAGSGLLAHLCLIFGGISAFPIVMTTPVGSLSAVISIICGVAALIKLLIEKSGERRVAFTVLQAIIGLALASFSILVVVSAFTEAQVRSRVARTKQVLATTSAQLGAAPAGHVNSMSISATHDPFAPDQPLQYKKETSGGITLWSRGPDGSDDKYLIEYDPTNGTTSRGDILFRPDEAIWKR